VATGPPGPGRIPACWPAPVSAGPGWPQPTLGLRAASPVGALDA
jgi:hypothetical protein